MDWKRVVVAMPAYNEHEGIADFIREIEENLAPACSEIVFVVVDDASTTPLHDMLKPCEVESRIVVHRNAHNQGHGPSALRAYGVALEHSPDAIIHVDGDGQFHGVDFPRLLVGLEDHDVVIGARTRRRDPWFRRLISRGLCAMVGDPRIPDVNSPFRAYRPLVLRELLAATPTGSLVPHIHFSKSARSLPYPLTVVPVRHRDRLGAQAQGTSWGHRPRRVVPPGRLALFCMRALLELYWTKPKSGPVRSPAPLPMES